MLGLAALLVLSTAAVSAGATLLALRGAVISAPRATAPEQTPAPGSAWMAGFSVADPRRGEPRWTMRLATSRTGLLCSTVGQLDGGRTGAGAVARRSLPERLVSSGIADRDVRDLTFATPNDVRTIAPTGPGHAFIVVYAGSFPTGRITTTTTFRDGRTRRDVFPAMGI